MYVINTPQIQIEKKRSGFKIKTSLKIFAILFLVLGLGTVGAYFYGNEVIEKFNMAFVTSTEYWLDDNAFIIVRLMNYQGQPITSATCNASLLYENDSYMFQNQAMSSSTLAGNYYTSVFLNSTIYPLGVYTKQVDCYVGARNQTITKTFHVNPALEYLKSLNTSQIAVDLSEINQTTYNIYNDTQYIANNLVTATNFESWKNNATVRFDNIDGNLTIIEDFCSNTETNSSALCQEIYNIRNFQEATNVTYTAYFETIDNTTTNTFNYVTGTLATNVNNIYTLLQSVNSTVVSTNVNVTDIRQDQLDEINLVIIS